MTTRIYCDGCCLPTNPGGVACWGLFTVSEDGEEQSASGFICEGEGTTSNFAEMTAAIKALQWARTQNLTGKDIAIYVDSEFTAKVLNQAYKLKAPNLRPLYETYMQLRQEEALVWIPREQNTVADKLASQEADRHLQSHGKACVAYSMVERRERARVLVEIMRRGAPRTATSKDLAFILGMDQTLKRDMLPTDKQMKWLENLYERC